MKYSMKYFCLENEYNMSIERIKIRLNEIRKTAI